MNFTKKATALLLALLLLCAVPLSSLALTPASVEDLLTFVPVGSVGSASYHYEISGNTITDSIDLVIPSTYEGYKVTAIRKDAFKSCGYITSLTVPATVTSIKSGAFEGCLNLKTVTFEGANLTLSANVFKGCSGLESVTLPSALVTVPDSCFEGCVSLRTCPLPATVTAIGTRAFSNCTALTSVSIGPDLTEIGDEAFAACASVTAYTVDSANPNYKSENGILLSSDGTELIYYPGGRTIVDYTVPEGVTVIKKMAFAKSKYLMNVNFASTVKTVEEYAFSEASELRSVNFNKGLTTIGEMAFQRCTSLNTVTIPSTVETFDSAFFASGVKTVILEEGITTVCEKAFDSCTQLSAVTLPASLATIELGAFNNCPLLTFLTLGPNVANIDDKAFNGDDNLVLNVSFDTPAYAYAVKNNIPFSTVDESHVALTNTVSELRWESSAAFSAQPQSAKVIWTSSNPAAVTVDEKGNIKAVGKGSAVIRAALQEDETVYDEVTVTVTFTFWQKIVYFFRNLFSFLKK